MLAIIGAGYLQRPLVERAKEMGLKTLCFAWEEGAVCKDLADAFYPLSIREKEAILEVCRTQQIDGICTIASDVAAPTVAYVAQALGLPGNPYEVALRANDKGLMREAFAAAGVRAPRHWTVGAGEALPQIETWPLIVKPTDRSGSLGVTKVSTATQLAAAVNVGIHHSFSGKAIVEQFIEGREISVECISYQGTHHPLAITDKTTTGAPHFVELAHAQPAKFSAAEYAHIYDLTCHALDALGITHGASHSEFKITAQGEVYVMEIGARMGGDFIGSHLVQLSTGYDFLRGVIEAALGTFSPPQRLYERQARVVFSYDASRPLTCSGDRKGYCIFQDGVPVLSGQ